MTYHQLKLVLIFAAMRHRAAALKKEGWQVDYVELNESFIVGLEEHVRRHRPAALLVQDPSQYDLSRGLPALARRLGVKIEILPENQFLCSRSEFAEWAEGKNRLLMEHHYRRMRRKLDILLEPDGEPTGGAWNFDAENRETFPSLRRSGVAVPPPPRVAGDAITRDVIGMVEREFARHPGEAKRFWLPVTRGGSAGVVVRFRDASPGKLRPLGGRDDGGRAGAFPFRPEPVAEPRPA